MASLLAGQGVAEVSAQYNLPDSTVSDLKACLESEFGDLRTKKGKEIEELLFKYLKSNIQALDGQARVVSEREYIRKHPADSLAVLHGVMAEKSIRLLEAIERARIAGPKELPANT